MKNVETGVRKMVCVRINAGTQTSCVRKGENTAPGRYAVHNDVPVTQLLSVVMSVPEWLNGSV